MRGAGEKRVAGGRNDQELHRRFSKLGYFSTLLPSAVICQIASDMAPPAPAHVDLHNCTGWHGTQL